METPWRFPVRESKAQLTDQVRRGAEVVLTRFGEAVAKLVPVAPRTTAKARRAVLDTVRASRRVAAPQGPGAARSQDFLHDEVGLPW